MGDVFNWITEFASTLGIVMGLVWMFKKNWWFVRGHYLALYLIFFSLILLEQNLYWTTFYLDNPHLLLLTDPLALLLGPLLFFFVSDKLVKYKWIHFVPAIIITLIYLPIYLSGSDEKAELLTQTIWKGNGINSAEFVVFRILLMVQILGYGYYIQAKLKFAWNVKNFWINKISSEQIMMLSYALFGLTKVAWLIFTFFMNYDKIEIFDTCIRLVTMLSVFYLFFNAMGSVKVKRKEPYHRSVIEHGDVILLKRQLTNLMNDAEPYLNRNLKMIEIASYLNISEHKLSQLLNIYFETNFYEYINMHRVNKARLLLRNPEYNKYTIEAIARECGFNSKSTFNEAFKKIEGTTPSAFKKTTTKLE